MQIIISPAKKMVQDTDSLPWQDLPYFIKKSCRIAQCLQQMDQKSLQKLWRCSDKLAEKSFAMLQQMDLYHRLTPAILAYEGIQYQYMAPGVFTQEELCYLQRSLRILSGFYGVLRPLDGVAGYRLELASGLKVDGAKDLYAFWGNEPALLLQRETDCVLNLASAEYSRLVRGHLDGQVRWVDCVFWDKTPSGRLVEKGTLCKMARGEMVRYLTEQKAEEPDCMRRFDRLGFRYWPEQSAPDRYCFLRGLK
ncbi:MAG: peroxide stress protein YaaA [Pygmaiobacter massiliensis]|nr:peroxide stress protein YaaA [Pygmaiobacter massiliensis]